LAGGPLRGLALEVAHGHIVEERVAEYVAERLIFRDMSATLADDNRKFALVIELNGTFGPDHRCACSHERGRHPQKEGRIGRYGMPTLLGVQGIVEADADDLACRPDGQRRLDPVEAELGRFWCLGGGSLDANERAWSGGDQGLEVLWQ